IPLGGRVAGLAVYGAFWEVLLAHAFYRLARALGFSRGWSAVQVVGTVAFFGTNLFSFYRYYSLASTPLASLAYLHGLRQWVRVDRPPASRSLVPTAAAAVVAWANHEQELLFLLIVVPALLAFDRVSALPDTRRRGVIVL